MKRLLRLLVVVIGVVSLSSCGTHTGTMYNSTSLSQPNFKYVQKNIKGSATSVYFLGIGGFSESIAAEAKQNMLSKVDLKPNQALANLTVNWKSGFYILLFNKTCTVTADIVEFE